MARIETISVTAHSSSTGLTMLPDAIPPLYKSPLDPAYALLRTGSRQVRNRAARASSMLSAMSPTPATELARFVWRARYRDPNGRPREAEIEDTWQRVARAVASVERNPALWSETFLNVLRDYRLVPGGRILAGAGTDRNVTLANCFVMGAIRDSM